MQCDSNATIYMYMGILYLSSTFRVNFFSERRGAPFLPKIAGGGGETHTHVLFCKLILVVYLLGHGILHPVIVYLVAFLFVCFFPKSVFGRGSEAPKFLERKKRGTPSTVARAGCVLPLSARRKLYTRTAAAAAAAAAAKKKHLSLVPPIPENTASTSPHNNNTYHTAVDYKHILFHENEACPPIIDPKKILIFL